MECGDCPLIKGSENCKAVGDMCKDGGITAEEIRAILGMKNEVVPIRFDEGGER